MAMARGAEGDDFARLVVWGAVGGGHPFPFARALILPLPSAASTVKRS